MCTQVQERFRRQEIRGAPAPAPAHMLQSWMQVCGVHRQAGLRSRVGAGWVRQVACSRCRLFSLARFCAPQLQLWQYACSTCPTPTPITELKTMPHFLHRSWKCPSTTWNCEVAMGLQHTWQLWFAKRWSGGSGAVATQSCTAETGTVAPMLLCCKCNIMAHQCWLESRKHGHALENWRQVISQGLDAFVG